MEHDPAPEGARKALIDAGLRLFGAKGFAATSTREITQAAGVNIALIAYHFGGKEGLRLACGAEVARRMRGASGLPIAATTPDEALACLQGLIRAMVHFLCTSDEAAPVVAFMLQEVMQGGPVLDAVYDAFIGPKHAEISNLWALASGQPPGAETVRLQVFALVGQIAYFRFAQKVVTRKMGWPAIGPAEAARIADLLSANLRALIGARP